jgi:UDPglucose--hexose-1-phosphate uridylyltransferase
VSFLRFDVTTNDWVIFAPERAGRPQDLRRTPPPQPERDALCPFCSGSEGLASPEIFALRSAGPAQGAGWTVRVVPNKFPALRIEGDYHRNECGPLYRSMGGCGAHEVIIESPEHDRFLGHHPVGHIESVLRTLQLRLNDLLRDTRSQTIVIFKNHGTGAGSSLQHPHWQLMATPVVPRQLRLKHAVATDYFDLTGDCLYCVLVQEELRVRDRIVTENDHFVALMPFAAHSPFETWILPKSLQPSFGLVVGGSLRPLAEVLKVILCKLYTGLGNPAFNLTIHTAPRDDEHKSYFLWHIEIIPALNKPAGFELGSGMAINTVLPEEATRFLRNVAVADV